VDGGGQFGDPSPLCSTSRQRSQDRLGWIPASPVSGRDALKSDIRLKAWSGRELTPAQTALSSLGRMTKVGGLSGPRRAVSDGRLRGSARTSGGDAVPALEGDTALGDWHLEGPRGEVDRHQHVMSAADNRSPATNSTAFSLASKSP
jgi:hypothetical protein